MYGFLGSALSPSPWLMIVVSCCSVKAVPRPFSDGTSADTPPTPPMPWHCAQANCTKSCAPAATVLDTVVVVGVVVAGPDRWMIVVWLDALSRPTNQAVSATATITRPIAATAIPTAAPPPLDVFPASLPVDMAANLAVCGDRCKRRNYVLPSAATSCIDAAHPRMRDRARAGSLVHTGRRGSASIEKEPLDMANAPNGIRSATREDLLTAMHSEAFAYASYMLYAATARAEGRKEIADLFETTAQAELQGHFARLAQEAGLMGGDAANLRAAIELESYAIEVMYPSFAEHATAAGDAGAAAAFTLARDDDVGHLESFREALLEVTP